MPQEQLSAAPVV
jgi:DNA-binding NtrC family response regulator